MILRLGQSDILIPCYRSMDSQTRFALGSVDFISFSTLLLLFPRMYIKDLFLRLRNFLSHFRAGAASAYGFKTGRCIL